jgi:hypothetical protein
MDRAFASPASLSSTPSTRASPSHVTTARLRAAVAGPSYWCRHSGSVGSRWVSSLKSSGFGPPSTQPCTPAKPPTRSAVNANVTPRRLTFLAYPSVVALAVIGTTRAMGATELAHDRASARSAPRPRRPPRSRVPAPSPRDHPLQLRVRRPRVVSDVPLLAVAIQASKARLKIVIPASAARLAGEAAASSGSQAGVLFSGHGARALRVGQLDARTDRSRSALGGDLEGRRAGARADPTRRAAPDRSVQDDRAFVRTGRLSRSTAGIPADVRARRAAAPLREAAPAVNEVFRAAADLQAFCDAQGWRHALIGGLSGSGGASRVRRWTSTSRW